MADIARCTLQLRVHVVRHGPRRAPRGRQLPEALRTQDVRPVAPPAYCIPLLFADADPGTPLKMVASVPQPVVYVRAWPQNCTWSIIVRLHTCTCAACCCIRHEALEFLPFFLCPALCRASQLSVWPQTRSCATAPTFSCRRPPSRKCSVFNLVPKYDIDKMHFGD